MSVHQRKRHGAWYMSWRDVHVPHAFLERLKEMRARAKSDYLVEYRGKQVGWLRRSFRSACTAAGITYDVILYDIRHLYSTTLLSRGGDLAAVSAQLGHASTVMTANVYYHEMAGERRRAVELLPELARVAGDVASPAK